jgi:hypothetical protein
VCTDWARTARSDRERAIFLQMAETWRQAADRLERVQHGSFIKWQADFRSEVEIAVENQELELTPCA